jgi:hypothetical protein
MTPRHYSASRYAIVAGVTESDMTALHKACDRLWREGGQTFPLLHRCLQRFDPHTAPDDEVLLHAVLLYVPTAAAGDPTDPAVMDWMFYAWRAAVAVYGSGHPRALAAAELLAQILRHHESAPAAISLYRGLAAHYQRRERHAEHARVALALADTLHEHGACRQSHRTAEAMLRGWGPHYGGQVELGPVLLLHTLRMLDMCGRIEEARRILHTHAFLLPADDVTREAVAALALILLGRADEIIRHRGRCGGMSGRRRTFTQVRRVFLTTLMGDACYGDPRPEPDGPLSDPERFLG